MINSSRKFILGKLLMEELPTTYFNIMNYFQDPLGSWKISNSKRNCYKGYRRWHEQNIQLYKFETISQKSANLNDNIYRTFNLPPKKNNVIRNTVQCQYFQLRYFQRGKKIQILISVHYPHFSTRHKNLFSKC